jgi:sugar transferase (PEP-CTERM/EpsH1 system associated)
MARLALEPPLEDVPFVLDLVDVDSQKWTELADRSAGFMRWVYRREARHLGAFEAVAATRAATTVVINQREADIAHRLAPAANIHVIGNGVDVEGLRPSSNAPREARVVFCGVMNYAPNEDAALWLAAHVWPLVRARRSGAKLTLVGANPTARIKAACGADRTIELAGTVPDVRPFLWGATVAVAPLRVARGLQNKVLEALAAGLPNVITPAVAEGLPLAVRQACLVAHTPERFAAAICELLDLSDDDRRARVARAALEELDWHRSLAPLWDVLQGAATRPVPALSLVAV